MKSAIGPVVVAMLIIAAHICVMNVILTGRLGSPGLRVSIAARPATRASRTSRPRVTMPSRRCSKNQRQDL